MGLDSYFTLDFSMACFFFWLLTSFFYKKIFFFFFNAFLLVSTREMGIVALLGFYIGYFFYQFMTNNNKTILKRFLWTFKDTFFKIFTIIVFFSLLYSFINIFGHGGAADLASSYGNIAFDWNFVQSKFKGYFSSNFSWLCIGVSVVIIFFLKKKNIYKNHLISFLQLHRRPVSCMQWLLPCLKHLHYFDIRY